MRWRWLDGYATVENLLMLWDVKEERLIRSTSSDAMAEFTTDAAAIALQDPTVAVAPLLASSVDSFVAKSGSSRRATVGLFHLTG